MPHCNVPRCSRSTRYDGDVRVCDCPCAICADRPLPPPRRAAAELPPPSIEGVCEGCGARLAADDAFCDACGAETSEDARAAAHARAQEADHQRTVARNLRQMKMTDASRAIGGLAVLFALIALYALAKELRGTIVLVQLVLAAIMGGLFAWSKRSPLPAIATALVVYVAVQFVYFLLNPATLNQGWVLKGLAIAVLVGGLRAALVAQSEEAARE
jgi:hypothetical protein